MKASTTRMSMDYMRDLGYVVDVVERWVPGPSGLSVRKDLFGFLDLVAIRDSETVGVQTTTKGELSRRVRKITASPLYPIVLGAGWRIVVHGWHQPRGPRTRYECVEMTVGEPVDV